MSILLLILGLVLFVLLVVVHEWGHFLAARRGGVDVEEFGIGFPPRAVGKKLKSGMLLSLNWLPLGGFVRLKGEQDADTAPRSYGAASLKTKTKIMLAGVTMNLLVAFLMLTILAWAGMPQLIENQFTVKNDTRVIQNQVLIGYIEPDSPAQKSGLMPRDELVSITSPQLGAQQIESGNTLPDITKQFAGQTARLTINRGDAQQTLNVTLRTAQEVAESANTDDPKGYLGISPSEYKLQRSTWSAPIVALGLMVQFTVLTLQGIGHALMALLQGNGAEASRQVAGPVGIFSIIKNGSILGYQFILIIIAVISLTLAIINALPIPALDGGRLFVTWLYRLLKKPLTKTAEARIHGTGFALLIMLFVLITIVDIGRSF